MKRVLMVAFHFPPMAGSSGVQRGLRFAQYLPQFGWEPLMLTAHARAYEQLSAASCAEIPPGMVVRRAQAFDSARHLAVAGRYPAAFALPDRWVTWKFDAIRLGMALIRKHRPDVLWSTFPIATAHVIGAELQRRAGLPWVADFRDPMAQEGYPEVPRTWRAYEAIERHAFMTARGCVLTTPSAARAYRERYPEAAARVEVIENGYDEASFNGLDAEGRAPLHPGSLTLLHSGIVYPSERDPTQLFVALRALRDSGKLAAGRLRIRFRGAVHDDMLRRLAAEQGVAEMVETLPPIGYRAALQEMLRADALLVLQASNCNEQIPAKLYEYLRGGRPVLGLTDPAGDTAGALRNAGLDTIARLDCAVEIADTLLRFVDEVEAGLSPRPDAKAVAAASRVSRTASLAALFARVSN